VLQKLDLLSQHPVFLTELGVDEALEAAGHARQQLLHVHTAVPIHVKGADERVIEAIGLKACTCHERLDAVNLHAVTLRTHSAVIARLINVLNTTVATHDTAVTSAIITASAPRHQTPAKP
jgi:hypothetical protein